MRSSVISSWSILESIEHLLGSVFVCSDTSYRIGIGRHCHLGLQWRRVTKKAKDWDNLACLRANFRSSILWFCASRKSVSRFFLSLFFALREAVLVSAKCFRRRHQTHVKLGMSTMKHFSMDKFEGAEYCFSLLCQQVCVHWTKQTTA